MMQNLVMKLLAIFIVSAIVKLLIHMMLGVGFIAIGVGILVDVGVLGYIYVLLKEYRYINLNKTMMFLGGITFVSILVDLRIVPGDIGNLIILGVIAWMIFGKDGFFGSSGGRRYR